MKNIRNALDGGPPVLVGNSPPDPRTLPPRAALVLPTSGSSGRAGSNGSAGSGKSAGRYVWLSADALIASAHATFAALQGPGLWALSLPTDHIAGIQVIVRSVLAGFEPSVNPDILTAIAGLGFDEPRYTSIVPTQLVRAVEKTDPKLRQALASMDAVLVGGAALSEPIRQSALDAGINVVTTYGMTETAGGCVYNRKPLAGVEVKLVDNRIHLAGPMLAGGYVEAGVAGDGSEFYHDGHQRWFITSDIGELTEAGLRVLGRADQAINTGGFKVHPAHVEELLRAHVAEVMVLGLPDDEWGEIVTVIVDDPAITLAQIRSWCEPSYVAPRGLIQIDEFPRLGIGKLDRAQLIDIARQAHATNQVQRWR